MRDSVVDLENMIGARDNKISGLQTELLAAGVKMGKSDKELGRYRRLVGVMMKDFDSRKDRLMDKEEHTETMAYIALLFKNYLDDFGEPDAFECLDCRNLREETQKEINVAVERSVDGQHAIGFRDAAIKYVPVIDELNRKIKDNGNIVDDIKNELIALSAKRTVEDDEWKGLRVLVEQFGRTEYDCHECKRLNGLLKKISHHRNTSKVYCDGCIDTIGDDFEQDCAVDNDMGDNSVSDEKAKVIIDELYKDGT